MMRIVYDTCAALEQYQEFQRRDFDHPERVLADDALIGDEGALPILQGLVAMLNGKRGNMDGGRAHRRILNCATKLGFNEDDL